MDIDIFQSDEDGGYIATCKDFPGMSAFGKTKDAAVEEIKMLVEQFGHLWLHRKPAADDAAKEVKDETNNIG